MMIHATFANRKYDPNVVELIDAWDEYCVEENFDGFEQSRRGAIASWGDDLLRWVTVVIDVDTEAIYDALNPDLNIPGRVTHVGEVEETS